jgi:Tfp pilus assembly protein FimT
MSKSKKQLAAFTLLEMTVSLSVIVVVTALFIANFKSANKRTDLTMTAQNLVSDLHAAQNNTLGLTKYNNLMPLGGWGVHLEVGNNTYTTFADLDAPGEPGYMSLNEGEAEIIYGARTTTLPEEIEILSLKTGSAMTPNAAINVTFLPPDPQTNIYAGAGATSTSLLIELREKSSQATKTVRVNFLGLIEVVND